MQQTLIKRNGSSSLHNVKVKHDFNVLQVVLKTIERCNLACTYCYYFYGGDESYKTRPAKVQRSTLAEIAEFIRSSAEDLNIKRVSIAFHGGEPTLQKPADFAHMCQLMIDRIGSVAALSLSIQTNATRITREWVELLERYRVGVGVSLDGPQIYNDQFRLDHKGRGAYQSAANGIDTLRTSHAEGRLPSLGVISVINSRFDYAKVFANLCGELGFNSLSFLLPDCHYGTGLPNGSLAKDYGEILCQIFDCWVTSENECNVRQIQEVLSFFQIKKAKIVEAENGQAELNSQGGEKYQVIVIHSDGVIAPTDSYMLATKWQQSFVRPKVTEATLAEFLDQPAYSEINSLRSSLPKSCRQCGWRNLCKGGDLENRYTPELGFDRPSIYCEGLKIFYGHIVNFLIDRGYPRDLVEKKLIGMGDANMTEHMEVA